MLVLICEYVAEPIHACPEERKLWKKKMIDVHAVKKNKKIRRRRRRRRRRRYSLHDLPYETKKQDSCV